MFRLTGALLLLSLIWGMSFVFIKMLLDPAGVWGVVFLRCAAGALVLIPLLLVRGIPPLASLPWGALILVGVLNAALPWALIAWSETQIQSNTASILNATTPIWTSLVGFFVYSVHLERQQWTGVFIGFVGILILMDFQVTELFGEQQVGIGTMLLATICYGFASHHAKRYLKNVGILVIATVTLLIGTVSGLIGMAFTRGFSPEVLLTPPSLAAIVGLGALGSGIAYLLYYYMIAEHSASFAANVTYLIPVTAMIWGAVLLQESISSQMLTGLLVILTGVYLSGRRRKGTDAPSPPGERNK
jgi:drug/metabolite transporter (DMT)-like permease